MVFLVVYLHCGIPRLSLPPTFIAVSYTHLDVYKRQVKNIEKLGDKNQILFYSILFYFSAQVSYILFIWRILCNNVFGMLFALKKRKHLILRFSFIIV